MKIIIELIIYMAILLLICAAVVKAYDKYICKQNDRNYRNSRNSRKKKIEYPCPHGYTDWDDCPDCRH